MKQVQVLILESNASFAEELNRYFSERENDQPRNLARRAGIYRHGEADEQ